MKGRKEDGKTGEVGGRRKDRKGKREMEERG